jgi:trans-aconitate 2-methyltransferase
VSADSEASSSQLFVADPAQVEWLGSRIVNAIATRPPGRVLDIGCGDGSLLAYLANALPGAELVGVDLSQVNVAAARARLEATGSRVTLEEGDYLKLQAGRFDLVVASSTLQGIRTSTRDLAAKLASDIAPGGRLIHVTPSRCSYNAALNLVRRVLRLMRGSLTERLILTVARVLHRRQPVDQLRQRVSYMYLVLRHNEDTLRAELETRHHFRVLGLQAAPHTSLGQPRHRLAILSAPAA